MTRVACCMLLASFALAGCAGKEAERGPGPVTYATWRAWEVDRVASMWLIKRHVNRQASFEFIEKGEPLEGREPFDIPEAELQRKHNQPCFQVILEKHGLTDPALAELGRLVWDVEINYWGEKKFAGSADFKSEFDAVFAQDLSDQELLGRCFALLDRRTGSGLD